MRFHFLLGGILLLSACNSGKIIDLERQNKELSAQLAFVSQSKGLELQDQCSKQAHEEFRSLGWDKDNLASYTNHYSSTLNKCFMDIHVLSVEMPSKRMFTTKVVLDAFEHRNYGQYAFLSRAASPSMCTVTVGSAEQKCNSSEEFDSLVRQYMEQ